MFGSVERLGHALSFHRERHTVLAGNVANVDTPGYEPFDLERVTSSDLAANGLKKTHPGHYRAGPGGASRMRSFVDAGTTRGADGNAVSLERELAKIDANRVRYSATSELVSRRLAMLRYAASDGNA